MQCTNGKCRKWRNVTKEEKKPDPSTFVCKNCSKSSTDLYLDLKKLPEGRVSRENSSFEDKSVKEDRSTRANKRRKMVSQDNSGVLEKSEKEFQVCNARVDKEVKVWWSKEEKWYCGKVLAYDPLEKSYLVGYDDGDCVWEVERDINFDPLMEMPPPTKKGVSPKKRKRDSNGTKRAPAAQNRDVSMLKKKFFPNDKNFSLEAFCSTVEEWRNQLFESAQIISILQHTIIQQNEVIKALLKAPESRKDEAGK